MPFFQETLLERTGKEKPRICSLYHSVLVQMKLTVELIQNSPDFINTLRARELDLRDNKIPFIENLGATKDRYSSIDLGGNEIRSFENFPLLNTLDTLMLAGNKIERIEQNIGTRLPSLKWLTLANNQLNSLQQLSNLFLPSSTSGWKLESLSLIGNDVCNLPYYREWIIFGIPSLRVLDFVIISKQERILANSLFSIPKATTGSENENSSVEYSTLYHQILNGEQVDRKRHAIEIVEQQQQLTNEKRLKIQELIENAQNLTEIQQIERTLLLNQANQ